MTNCRHRAHLANRRHARPSLKKLWMRSMPVSSRAKRFWKRCIQSWGTKLTEQYGTTCPDDWCKAINRTDNERLDMAIIALRQETPIWPPTLGQLEAAIPRKQIHGGDSIPDRLAQYAVSKFRLCEHQSMRPWNYFGELVDDGSKIGFPITKGVVIQECGDCRQSSHRLLVTELPA